MSLLFRSRRSISDPTVAPSWAKYSTSTVRVSSKQAMRHSAVWAALRLRADLVSTCPVDVFRPKPGGIPVEQPPPMVLVKPSPRLKIREWLYASQLDLDRFGNAFGLVRAWNAFSLPAVIDLVPAEDVQVRLHDDGSVTYLYKGRKMPDGSVWHERQYPVAGLPIGLSPIAYAALSVQMHLSAQEFAYSWFDGGVAMPNGVLRNESKVLSPGEAQVVKDRFRESTRAGEPFVSGKDWTFHPMTAATNDAAWLNTQDASAIDIARFFGVPADVIDAAAKGSSITYANIAQRNLQLLTMHLGPAIARREDALSDLVAGDRYVKLNTDAMLRMDPQTRSAVLGQKIRDRMMAPSEARALEERQPFTPEQLAEFDELFPSQNKTELARALQQLYLSVGKVITPDEARTIANEQYGADLPVPGPSFDIGGTP